MGDGRRLLHSDHERVYGIAHHFICLRAKPSVGHFCNNEAGYSRSRVDLIEVDWAYEEEFGMQNSMCWSTDDSVLAFIRFDESKVPVYTFDRYKSYWFWSRFRSIAIRFFPSPSNDSIGTYPSPIGRSIFFVVLLSTLYAWTETVELGYPARGYL